MDFFIRAIRVYVSALTDSLLANIEFFPTMFAEAKKKP